jgi:hypothetical protein
MNARRAAEIRHGIRLFKLNYPRFSYRNAGPRIPFATAYTWARLERRAHERTPGATK